MPYLAALLILHPIVRRVYESIRPIPTRTSTSRPISNYKHTSAVNGEARLEQRASFDFGFALIFLTALHGFSALKILIILYINFSIATRLSRKYVPAATWVFNICTLFANELSEGYKLTRMLEYITPLDAEPGLWHGGAEFLDGYGGIMSRWEILFNLTVLRLISFNMDYYWSLDRKAGDPIEVSIICPYSILH